MSSFDPSPVRANPGNRLANEASAYLRQHADNPVNWYPWGEEALHKARREEKPIFLSIGYSSCHWCHVMEEEVFENEEIAYYLNEHFVSIKVDREERPDLDRIYMEAVQLLTRSGGWPMSVWLTPDLKPFFGGTYFPPHTFFDILQKLNAAWEENRDQIDDTAGQLYSYISRNPIGAAPEALSIDDVKLICERELGKIDHLYGGFEAQMKFPTPLRWQMLLHLYRRNGDLSVSKPVWDALVAMASGGLQDHVGGGFHRYTVDPSWTVPHFEKMLYDNAQLASLYLEAAAVFDDKMLFKRVAKRTLDFLLREMYDSDKGGFYGSIDADSEGGEGAFYVWTPEQIEAVTGKRDALALMMLFGVTPEGNFEGNRTVLTRRYPYEEVAARTGRPVDELKQLIDTYRGKLYEARSSRPAPALDRKKVTSWNALTVSAFAQGYRLFGDERYLEAAEKTVEFLRAEHWHRHSLSRTSTDGTSAGDGILDDYAFLGNALLDLYQANGRIEHLAWAVELAGIIDARFRHEQAGYYQTSVGTETPLGRQVEILDSVEPSGASAALHLMLRLAAVRADENRLRLVKEDVEAFAEIIKKAGLEMAGWLDVALLLHGPVFELVIVRPTDPATELPTRSALRVGVDEILPPYLNLIPLEDDLPTESLLELIPGIGDKPAKDGQITAYLCRFGSCEEPTTSADVLKRQLLAEWMK